MVGKGRLVACLNRPARARAPNSYVRYVHNFSPTLVRRTSPPRLCDPASSALALQCSLVSLAVCAQLRIGCIARAPTDQPQPTNLTLDAQHTLL